jgi:group I intron endonuclease
MYSGIIYCAISPSNKKYYGKTVRSFNKRIWEHSRNQGNWAFSNALRKYGKNSFKWEIIEKYEFDLVEKLNEVLNEREKYWIKKDKTNLKEFGYNMTDGGDGTSGHHYQFSEEHKKKLSESHKGILLSQEHKNNIGISNRGKEKSEEARKNMSIGKIGIQFSKEHKQHIKESKTGNKNPNWGKERSQETKNRIGKSNFGQKRSEETCKKIGISKKEIKISNEHKQKISKYRMGKSHSEESKNKMRIKAFEREAKKRLNNEIQNK